MADYAIHEETLTDIADVIRKKEGSASLIDPADYAERINLMGMLPEKTASSASICSFSDGSDDVPMSSVIAHIEPTLTGTNAVNVVQSGKNLLLPHKADSAEITVNGIKRSYSLDNQEFTFDGTNTKTDAAWLIYSINTSDFVLNGLKSGVTYRFSHNLTADFYAQFTYNKSGGGIGAMGYLRGTAGRNASVSFTLPSDFDSLKQFQIGVSNTATDVNITAHFQVEVGSTATEFEKYKQPTSYTANLGRTVYGADADLVSGQGTDSGKKETMTSSYISGLASGYSGYVSNLSVFNNHPAVWIRNFGYPSANQIVSGGIGCVCNHFPVSMNNSSIIATQYRIYFDVDGKNISSVQDFIDYVENLEQNDDSLDIVYEVSAPESFTFDGQEIPSLLGVNNLWHDDGETEVTYRADIDLALAQSSGTRGLMMASRSVSPMIGEEASLDRENILEEVSDYSDNEEETEEEET